MSQINRKKFIQQLALTSAGTALAMGCQPTEKKNTFQGSSNQNQKQYKWYMVTTWPPNFPVIGTSCTLFADLVREMSGGQLDIKVYGAGELIPALEVFDAVSSGTAQIGHGAAYYWTGKVQAAQFFAAVPFGLNALEQNAWLMHGGGKELWDTVYADYNLVPFIIGNTCMQMGGWFNREINTISDFKGLKMRIPGLAGKILKQVGATPVLVAGGEIYTNLERGVIDATEWLGPYHDQLMGFHRIAQYYYTPGWHEAGTSLELMVNRGSFESLPLHLQSILKVASGYINNWMTTEMLAANAQAYQSMKESAQFEIKVFPEKVLSTLRSTTEDILADLASNDAMIKKVFESYQQFQNQVKNYTDISEKLYYTNLNI